MNAIYKIPAFVSNSSKPELVSFSSYSFVEKTTNSTNSTPAPSPTPSTTATATVCPAPYQDNASSSGNGGDIYLVVLALIVIAFFIGKSRGGGDPTIRVRVDRRGRD